MNDNNIEWVLDEVKRWEKITGRTHSHLVKPTPEDQKIQQYCQELGRDFAEQAKIDYRLLIEDARIFLDWLITTGNAKQGMLFTQRSWKAGRAANISLDKGLFEPRVALANANISIWTPSKFIVHSQVKYLPFDLLESWKQDRISDGTIDRFEFRLQY